MHVSLLFALCLVVLVTAEPNIFKDQRSNEETLKFHQFSELDENWKAFKTTYGKTYKDASEEMRRKKIFAEHLEAIAAHNRLYSKGLTSFTMGINLLSDMEASEVGRLMTGYRGGTSPEKSRSSKLFVSQGNSYVADEVDWRSKGYVTPVKYQGECGSCWAFSATGTLEGQHFRKTGKLVSLSEQQLIDCDKVDGGCSGGWPRNAIAYVASNGGIDTEDSYPTEGGQGDCRYNASAVGATCTKDVEVDKSESALKAAVAEIGPIAVAIDALQPSFIGYSGGVYNNPNCTTEPNHAVLVVGYGKTNNGDEYWIVKNSWGATWGTDGYVLMARNKDNQCGISNHAVYPEV